MIERAKVNFEIVHYKQSRRAGRRSFPGFLRLTNITRRETRALHGNGWKPLVGSLQPSICCLDSQTISHLAAPKTTHPVSSKNELDHQSQSHKKQGNDPSKQNHLTFGRWFISVSI